jgi:hypothetical protein
MMCEFLETKQKACSCSIEKEAFRWYKVKVVAHGGDRDTTIATPATSTFRWRRQVK